MKLQKLQTVTLIKPHTHAGVKSVPGDEISVSPLEAGWLQENGVIAAADTPAANTTINIKE